MTNIKFHCNFNLIGAIDAVEYEPVIDAGDHVYVSDDPDEFTHWSVYVRYNPDNAYGYGGVDCVTDLDTKEQAADLAAVLEKLLF